MRQSPTGIQSSSPFSVLHHHLLSHESCHHSCSHLCPIKTKMQPHFIGWNLISQKSNEGKLMQFHKAKGQDFSVYTIQMFCEVNLTCHTPTWRWIIIYRRRKKGTNRVTSFKKCQNEHSTGHVWIWTGLQENVWHADFTQNKDRMILWERQREMR